MTTASTLNKCPECNAITLRPNSCDSCGWPKVRPKHAEAPKFESKPSAEIARAMSAKEREVNAFVAKYRAENPGASMRDASFAYMKQHGLVNKLPGHLRQQATESTKSFDDAMDDYREDLANVG